MVLPFVDEHTVEPDAPALAIWEALVAVLRPRGTGAQVMTARLLGCRETALTGAFPAVGATVPGFRVAVSEPPADLVLEGRHRFSDYALRFHVGDGRLTAETRAAFPGAAGTLYRAAVIGTRGHVVAVHRILRAVRRRAEARGD